MWFKQLNSLEGVEKDKSSLLSPGRIVAPFLLFKSQTHLIMFDKTPDEKSYCFLRVMSTEVG